MYVLGSNIGAIRSLHYSHDGQYLAAAGTYKKEARIIIIIINKTLYIQNLLILCIFTKQRTMNQVK